MQRLNFLLEHLNIICDMQVTLVKAQSGIMDPAIFYAAIASPFLPKAKIAYDVMADQ